MEAQSLLVLDLEKCTRCDDCVRACADAHDGVTRLIREGLRFDKYLVATSCRQCRDPLCMVGCPVGSIRRRNSLEVIIEDWCIGCGLCAKNCPYGNINMHPFTMMENDPMNAGRQRRWSNRRRLPAICAPITPSRAACTPARMMRRIAWTRTSFSAGWGGHSEPRRREKLTRADAHRPDTRPWVTHCSARDREHYRYICMRWKRRAGRAAAARWG